MSTIAGTLIPLDEAAIYDIDKLISIPLYSLVLKLQKLKHYSDLITFLPWYNRFQVDVVMHTAVQMYGKVLTDV